MPLLVKPVTPPSLQDSCIKFVVQNMAFWCKQSTNDLCTIGPELGSNPFDSLSGLVLEQLTDQFYRSIELYKCYHSNNLKDNFFQHLITPRLINVSLPYDEDTVKLASIRVPKLKKLALHDCFNSNLSFFPKFEHLEVLDVSLSRADDSFLEVLGTYCRNLRVLDLEDCSFVSDCGIQGLCMNVDNLGRKNTLGRCKSIQSLILGEKTGVTKKGLRMALENLPALTNLMHISTVEALAEMALNMCESNIPELALSTLMHYDKASYQSGYLELALSLCPLITNMCINETLEFHDKDLLSLRSLKGMKILEIHKTRPKVESSDLLDGRIPTGEITFDCGIDPVLKVIGSSLTKFEFSGFHNVNVFCIIECCPNLEYFRLEGNYSYTSSCLEKVQKSVIQERGNKLPILKKLCELRIKIVDSYHGAIFNRCDNFIESEILVTLLSSPLLTEIDVCNCDTVTDDVLLAAAKVNNFEHLEELSFVNCHFVTCGSICLFIQDGNPLKKIYLGNCKKISEKNCQYWKNQAIQKKWDLTISRSRF